MTRLRYCAMIRWLEKRPAALSALRLANNILPAVIYCTYIGMLVFLAAGRNAGFWRALIVPAAVFLSGTAVRAVLNRPRPYEVYGMAPPVRRDGSGNSFPSRHLFSAAVITVCGCWLWPPLGAVLAAVTALLAPARVLGGVHFIRDVIAGILWGGIWGWIGFFVL